ncbi:MAG: type II CAAX endopeptidase family protein [Treponemataceae bacterium]|nr:MAG: type II CAAX endopeptidase family protein [Treponemataceae bacterium]
MHTTITKSNRDAKKRSAIYLLLTVGVCLLVGIISILASAETGKVIFSALQKAFTAIAVLAVVVTRFLTKDKSGWNLSLKVWKNGKILVFSAFLPGLAILLGAGIYYLLFPDEIRLNAQALWDFCEQYGLPADIAVNARTIAITAIALWLASALAIPIHLLELGEEIGWRGYLLPQLLQFMSSRKAAVVSGILWGVMHAPLIYFGLNYGNGYWGAPYSGILLMIVFCVTIGILMSYTMIKTNNCMYAAIIHGAVNVAADMQIISLAVGRPLIGPAPTGIIGMSLLLIVALVLFCKFPASK